MSETRSLWQLAWPILVGQLATIGMSVTDVAMAGHASAQDLAGVSLGVSIWNMTILTLMGLLMSVSPVVAQHVGAQELAAVPHVVRQGLWKALAAGLVAALVANLGAQVFDHMALEPTVQRVAKGFVHIASAGLPAFACYRVLYGYSTSIGQTKPMMVIALAALLLNGLINWLLVFGHAGLPPKADWAAPGPPCCASGSAWVPCCCGCAWRRPFAAPGLFRIGKVPAGPCSKACSSWACRSA